MKKLFLVLLFSFLTFKAYCRELGMCDVKGKSILSALDVSDDGRKLFVTFLDKKDPKKVVEIDRVSTIMFNFTGLQDGVLNLTEKRQTSNMRLFQSISVSGKNGKLQYQFYQGGGGCWMGNNCSVQQRVNVQLKNCHLQKS